ncbi:HNH/ENDO VII family nuclease [Flavobacterium sp. T12S277]|uniref:HNH/ENDO VII family nuclease n=1 Tax=Flavobacterium sp. T12S277 TaxID=3402752 RepID=UPI003ADAE0AE
MNWDSFKYRNYDYAIGRFMCIDPLAEDYNFQSPYSFSSNRVIDHFELEGLEGEDFRFREQMKANGGIQARAEIDAEKANSGAFMAAVRLVTPVEDIYGVITGKDFDGNNYDRGQATAMIALTLFPEVKAEAKAGIVATEKGLVKASEKIVIDDAKKVDRALLNEPKKPGSAPTFKKDGTSVEIHHEGQNAKGPFQEMHKNDHRVGENYGKNHPSGQKPLTKTERKEFNQARREYWKQEYPKAQK